MRVTQDASLLQVMMDVKNHKQLLCLPNCQTHVIFLSQTSVKALSVEIWGLYAGLVLRDENFAGHLAAFESSGDFEVVEGKTCLRDGFWLDNARVQVTYKENQSY